jgi:hypothetical protein
MTSEIEHKINSKYPGNGLELASMLQVSAMRVCMAIYSGQLPKPLNAYRFANETPEELSSHIEDLIWDDNLKTYYDQWIAKLNRSRDKKLKEAASCISPYPIHQR